MAERSDHSDRDKRDRIERLRERLKKIEGPTHLSGPNPLIGVIRGILDLLADEL